MARDPATLPADPMARLLAIMAQLRAPEGGCPWDVAQKFETIAPYTIEEAYEVADAIEKGDMAGLRDELGDLLLQVVFHARMAEEEGHFDFAGVADAINEKMVRRHPHVFADDSVASAAAQTVNWEEIKAQERLKKNNSSGDESVLADLPIALPALTRAEKLQKRVARVGFDWPDLAPVLAKIDEEIEELKAEFDGRDQARIADEMGDLLFAVTNLARHLKVDPEAALRAGNAKFERRFRQVEATFGSRQALQEADLEAMEEAWRAAKSREKSGGRAD